jgi:mannan endo-1,4-beta-mannosidase
MKLGRVFLIAMAATLFVPLIGVESAGAQTIAYSPFIGADGTQLTLNGGPYQFTGLNIFNAAVNGSAEETCNVQLGTDGTAPLSQQLSNIDSGTGGNAKVFRFWMFQNLAIVGGSIDWSFLDNVFATAQADGFKVIPVLDDSDPSCEYSNQRKTDTWYQTGYTQVDPGNMGLRVELGSVI